MLYRFLADVVAVVHLGYVLCVVLGLVVWLTFENVAADDTVPPQLAGLIASFAGMVLGSFAFRSSQREATA